jgi:peroxiredoxin
VTLALGSEAPDFTLRGVDGAQHTLSDYDAAEILVLVQSCNHCPYVLAWEGRMSAIQRDYADRAVVLVAINSNDAERYPADSFAAMVGHAHEQGFPFDYLQDPEQTVARALGSERTPEVFVFDRDRRLRYHGAIDDNRNETAVAQNYLRDALDAVLAGATPTPTDTAPVGCSLKWRP